MIGSGGRLHRPTTTRLCDGRGSPSFTRPTDASPVGPDGRGPASGSGTPRWPSARLGPFAAGAAIALAAVVLYGILAPGMPPLTAQDVKDSIASALASVTPPPAFSQSVYQAVQPSLVLIQTKGVAPKGAGNDEGGGLGSGVVVNQGGDILTSRHVIHGATSIELTFADGSTSPGEIVSEQPQARHRRRPCDDPAPDAGPGDPRRSARGPARERGLCHRQPLRALRLDQRRCHLRARPLVPDARRRRRC